jgi:hypothetical protein
MGGYDEMTEPDKSMGEVAQQMSWQVDLMLCMQAGFGCYFAVLVF